MKLSYRQFSGFVNLSFALLGGWFLYAQYATLLRINFVTLKSFSILPLLCVAALFFIKKSPENRGALKPTESTSSAGIRGPWLPRWFGLAAPFFITGLFLMTGSRWLFWLFAVAYFAALRNNKCEPEAEAESNPLISSWEWVGLAACCTMAILLTLGSHFPDADDAYFVSLATATIDHPGMPLLGFDNIHRGNLPLVEQYHHFVQAYEFLIATIADITKIPVPTIYYIIFPAVFSSLGIMVHWILFRYHLNGPSALLGVVVLLLLLVFWGDGHRTFGNMTLVRLFQGKAVFLIVALPMIVHAALRYKTAPNWINWLQLMLFQSAGMGLTTNGLVVAPIASALVLLSRPQFTVQYLKILVMGLAASLILVPPGIGMLYHVSAYQSSLLVESLFLNYETVMGGHRTGLVLLALLFVPTLAKMVRLKASGWLYDYLMLGFFFLFCPAVQALLSSKIAAAFSWRIFWCLPIPFLLSLGAGMAGRLLLPRIRIGGVLAFLWIIGFVFAGPSSISGENWAWSDVGEFKVEKDLYNIAKRIHTMAPKDAPVLVPEDVAVYLCSFHGAPPLVGVRTLYFKKLKGVIPEQDFMDRILLLWYIGGNKEEMLLSMNEALEIITSREIATVVFSDKHPDASNLLRHMPGKGFRVSHLPGFVIAVRSHH